VFGQARSHFWSNSLHIRRKANVRLTTIGQIQ
jgi:hypothetical protein